MRNRDPLGPYSRTVPRANANASATRVADCNQVAAYDPPTAFPVDRDSNSDRNRAFRSRSIPLLPLLTGDCTTCTRRRRWDPLLHRNVQRFQSGLVFKAHRLCVSHGGPPRDVRELSPQKSVQATPMSLRHCLQ